MLKNKEVKQYLSSARRTMEKQAARPLQKKQGKRVENSKKVKLQVVLYDTIL